MEAVSILGTLLSIPIPADTRMLKPYEQEIVTVSCPNIKVCSRSHNEKIS